MSERCDEDKGKKKKKKAIIWGKKITLAVGKKNIMKGYKNL